jgi:2-polyprenyl-3-methyl-5-hydroxy-6-metoxy-1,4-benzoquinol methylase
MKDTKETIEYFTPSLGFTVTPYIEAGIKQGIHHIGRYQWACDVLPRFNPKTVLDIACGAGYGSFMLSRALPKAKITGGDYDERAVKYCALHYQGTTLRYTKADIVNWTDGEKPLGQFDAIVSFDTIEHLLHREIALLRMAENLSPDGVILFSTPCAKGTNVLNPGWEHHKLEYSYRDLYKTLARYFGEVVYPQHPDFPHAPVWDEINAGEMRYLMRMNPLMLRKPLVVNFPREAKL